ncbi:MAG: hypothetical protein GF398_03980 [Chitinivibrionales bacterium]|nr:hypothetical protein [Chitinivibrionales bacterium]
MRSSKYATSIALVLMVLVVCNLYAAPKPWGFYQIFWNAGQFERDLDETLALLGGSPKYVLFFRDLSYQRIFPAKAVSACHERNLVPVISLELCNWFKRKSNLLDEINAGTFDRYFRAWGDQARAHSDTIILRFGFEMNGDWFAWGEQPDAFRQAWIRAHKLISQYRDDTIVWMFSPNVLWSDRTFAKDILPYYPGDAYVDCIGLDGYNFGEKYSAYHNWMSYRQVFEKTISAVTAFGKPICISEIGCVNDDRKAAWLADFLVRVSNDQRISAFIYFNYDKSSEQEPNWRLDSDEQSLAVFRKWRMGNGGVRPE